MVEKRTQPHFFLLVVAQEQSVLRLERTDITTRSWHADGVRLKTALRFQATQLCHMARIGILSQITHPRVDLVNAD